MRKRKPLTPEQRALKNARWRQYRANNLEKIKAYGRDYYKRKRASYTEEEKQRISLYQKSYREKKKAEALLLREQPEKS